MENVNGTVNSSDLVHDKNIHPFQLLKSLSKKWNLDVYSEEFSTKLDESDIWPTYKDRFNYPKAKDLPNGIQKSSKLLNDFSIKFQLI